MAALAPRVSALSVYRSILPTAERPPSPTCRVAVSIGPRGRQKRKKKAAVEAANVAPAKKQRLGLKPASPSRGKKKKKVIGLQLPEAPASVSGSLELWEKKSKPFEGAGLKNHKESSLRRKKRVRFQLPEASASVANCQEFWEIKSKTAGEELKQHKRCLLRRKKHLGLQLPEALASVDNGKECWETKSKKTEGETLEKHKGCSLRRLLKVLEKVPHSRQRAAKLFEWVLAPIPPQHFFDQYWEKKPLLIQRHNPNYYRDLFSTAEFDAILRDQDVQFGINLDVTSYQDGKRETYNPVGRALPAVVWDFYQNGCSLRMLNPQAFSSTVWHFLSILQEQFGSMVGANTYLTPAGTQGFAPHYDDIEAFVIQLEGKKHWRVYSPRREAEVLPPFSSRNFDQAEIGEPILETVLEAGDMLYFPRGFIHQGDCLPNAHSLHITVSSYQRNSWGDLLEKLLPAALQMAIEEDVEYRQGLPMDYLEYMGVLNSDRVDPRRASFMQKVSRLITKLTDYVPVDAAVDQKAKCFLHDCLPPMLTESEKALSVYGHPARWEDGSVRNADVQVKGTTWVRLLRHGIVRLCNEGDAVVLYYTTENSRVYHKEEPKSCEIEPEYAESIEFLLSSYPKFVSVESLPCATSDDKIALASVLFEKGLLATKNPLLSV
ncbi:ribosomal oxygenase 1 [Anolis carolinensis]|uniref:Bifunctional lysine-specific demethylase and histidyl-hydroxylase n=1 Tax=Anolis carolinensis TaxID=28377 RepID=A0A803SWF3_ANOCA|nr:PREDICTED: bifunctional lysine-specific demethylase and histidyl-hydroxylase NO66 [Anolis carolinensis]|eukprot:XP_008102195.1 PREDICTED: bifunctional lysine-specific demethylase and histidyl-hydroxylase NO66 [Anolis carolinensis]